MISKFHICVSNHKGNIKDDHLEGRKRQEEERKQVKIKQLLSEFCKDEIWIHLA